MTLQLDAPSTGEHAPAVPARNSRAGRRARRRGPTGLPLRGGSGLTLGLVVLWLSLLVLLPLAAVLGKAFDNGWSGFWTAVTNKDALSALQLTLELAVGVAVVGGVMGTLVAWVLVRDGFRGSSLLGLVIDVPFALPTIVAGVVVLAVYGPDGIGPNLGGSRLGLFVALLFVTLPFTVRTVQPVLIDLDRDAEQAAASLGASQFATLRRIVLPQLAPAIASGAALTFARALGEYGSLVLISHNIPGQDQYASSLIYAQVLNADHPSLSDQQAGALATVLLLASVLVLVFLDVIQRRVARRG